MQPARWPESAVYATPHEPLARGVADLRRRIRLFRAEAQRLDFSAPLRLCAKQNLMILRIWHVEGDMCRFVRKRPLAVVAPCLTRGLATLRSRPASLGIDQLCIAKILCVDRAATLTMLPKARSQGKPSPVSSTGRRVAFHNDCFPPTPATNFRPQTRQESAG
jgi:hypothetical protein